MQIDIDEGLSNKCITKDENKDIAVSDAAVHHVPRFEGVILCACESSATRRLGRNLNIRQIIIDDCGMGPGIDRIAQLLSLQRPSQVVLIGDEKHQRTDLQRILLKKLAADNVGFQECLKDDAVLLHEQYRMVIRCTLLLESL